MHNAASKTEAPNKRPRVSYAEKLKSSFPNASTEKLLSATSRTPRSHHPSQEASLLPTASSLSMLAASCVSQSAKLSKTSWTWALTHAPAQSLTSPSSTPLPVSFS
ncbi:hypothetical protein DSO57_1032371 [Entomophthora muscae]|uniref:Uncharacterized protein n=1 Tax=Entomophthora muscae TaxID=34485 RepID=A0ACC2RF35_9FUNG|nr:hypothetical protein DSO57_1032371 [Entomophthora muscae]